MRITVLGSGQDGGFPQFGATHPNDVRARTGELLDRTAPSVLVETGGVRLLLDASPDLRIQWRDRAELPDAIALTHAHIGHYTGLIHFGREVANAAGVTCHLTPRMLEFLKANQPWRQLLDLGNIAPETTNPFVSDAYNLELIQVPHRAEHSDTVAISVDSRLLYLPDIDSWDLWPQAEAEIARHEIAFLDATFWSEDELSDRQRSEVPHPFVTETRDRFAHLDTKIVLTHLNHSNPLVDPISPESTQIADLGWTVARDGLTTNLD